MSPTAERSRGSIPGADRIIEAALESVRADIDVAPAVLDAQRVLVGSLADEARLHSIGVRLAVRELARAVRNHLLVSLESSLREEPLRHPARPIIIIGQPRTGSTLLQNLLSLDEQLRHLKVWEAASPSSLSSDGTRVATPAERRRAAAEMLATLDTFVPQFRTIHPMELEGPEECQALLRNTGASMAFDIVFSVPSYATWLRHDADMSWHYAQYAMQLAVLEGEALGGEGPPRRWILKSPSHALALQPLLEVFPDAVLIRTRRDLVDVIPSFCSLVRSIREMYAPAGDPHTLGSEWMMKLVAAELELEAFTERHRESVIDVQYSELLRDPVEVLERVYTFAGMVGSPGGTRRVERWLADHRDVGRGNTYSLTEFGLSRLAIEHALSEAAG